MRIVECEQGSDEWFAARAGIPTASRFDSIVCPPDARIKWDCGSPGCSTSHTAENAAAKCKGGTGRPVAYTEQTVKLSQSRTPYMHELLAEWLCGHELESFESEWMARGKELETQARAQYELDNGVMIQQVGLVKHDTLEVGCSPDGLTENSGLELKCPKPHTHIKYLLANKCPSEYYCQVQGGMWLCEREQWDFVSFHPELPMLRVTVERNEEFIKQMSDHIAQFIEEMEAKRQQLEGLR